MATKEDVLEQIVEEYLIHAGYFVRHNIKFRPRRDHPSFISNKDSNHSDIDVVGIHPLKEGHDRVWVVSCKSWQAGFKPRVLLKAIADRKIIAGREAWKGFRELVEPKWSEAFVKKIVEITGSEKFTYCVAVSQIKGDRSEWESNANFYEAIGKNPIRLLSFREMINKISPTLGTTVAGSEIGRLLQMFHASGYLPTPMDD
jgi:hypothetical protein